MEKKKSGVAPAVTAFVGVAVVVAATDDCTEDADAKLNSFELSGIAGAEVGTLQVATVTISDFSLFANEIGGAREVEIASVDTGIDITAGKLKEGIALVDEVVADDAEMDVGDTTDALVAEVACVVNAGSELRVVFGERVDSADDFVATHVGGNEKAKDFGAIASVGVLEVIG